MTKLIPTQIIKLHTRRSGIFNLELSKDGSICTTEVCRDMTEYPHYKEFITATLECTVVDSFSAAFRKLIIHLNETKDEITTLDNPCNAPLLSVEELKFILVACGQICPVMVNGNP